MISLEGFAAKFVVELETGCWMWTGAKQQRESGIWYGVYNHRYAHRLSYELYVGPIPDGLVIDHKCSVGLCVNPEHLQAVTQSENTYWTVRRGRHGWSERPTHCPHGHPYAGDNLRLSKDGKHAVCRTCGRLAQRRHRERNPKPKKGNFNASKTHCKYGHELTQENVAILKDGYRLCKTCHRERSLINRLKYFAKEL